ALQRLNIVPVSACAALRGRWGDRQRFSPGGETEPMSETLSRREFLVTGALTGAAASAGLAGAHPLFAAGRARAVHARAARAVVVASANGHRYRNGGTETAVERACRMITDGADGLDAVVAGSG